jgi:hypothetical protein
MSDNRLSQEDIEGRIKNLPDTTLEGRVPVAEGVVDGGIENPTLEDLNKLPPLKRVELSDSLHSLSNDFVFFNHTALFSKGGLDFDPLKEYQIWADNQDLVSYVIFNRSIFSGLDYPDNSGGHDRMLSFVPIEHWHVIEKAIGKFTILNRAKGHMFLCEMVKVRIPDPKQPSLTIEPYLWKMNGSSHSWGYKGFPVPKLVKLPASYEAKYLMKVVNNEPSN